MGTALNRLPAWRKFPLKRFLPRATARWTTLREATDQELSDKLTISAARIADLRSAINFLAPIVESTPESSAVELKMPAATESGDAKE